MPMIPMMLRSLLLVLVSAIACTPRPASPPPTPTAVPEAPSTAPKGAEGDQEPPPPLEPPIPTSPSGVPIPPCPADGIPGMVCLEGGPSARGDTGEHACDQGEAKMSLTHHNPPETVWLSSFFLDTHEVSYAEYQACVAEGACPARQPGYLDFRRDELPMTGVSWYEARAYCTHHGKRLPTEAEFERAARLEGAVHPWGPEPADCTRAIVKDERGRGCGTPMRGSRPDTGRPAPSGSRPAFFGVYDILGNVEEWVEDWYQPFESCGEACMGTDPAGPCAGEARCPPFDRKVVKGGSWYWGSTCATATNRRPHVPSNDPYHHFGFRCAASVEQALSQTAPSQ
ncbi:MAG: formylglycine-generating enzyme family protein [Deltaproteobacteria bacterium]|nr:MAG: formylglycine-generating enzyme family protein [Deltaproteobacteria bacterium]